MMRSFWDVLKILLERIRMIRVKCWCEYRVNRNLLGDSHWDSEQNGEMVLIC